MLVLGWHCTSATITSTVVASRSRHTKYNTFIASLAALLEKVRLLFTLWVLQFILIQFQAGTAANQISDLA